MKIYRCIEMDWNFNVLKEDSFEYSGSTAQCKGGALRAQREARVQADKAFQQQQEMMDFQKSMLAKQEEGVESEEAKEAARGQRILAQKRQGRESTMSTVSWKPHFLDFEAKYKSENPLVEGEDEEKYNKKLMEAYNRILPFNYMLKGVAAPTKKAAMYA